MFLPPGLNIIFSRKDILFSALFYGAGSFKREMVYEICAKHSPLNVDLSKSCDILEFQGYEGIADFRELLSGFDSFPKELSARWLIINNAELLSKEVNNLLLKTVEERKNFHVFLLTADKDSISSALLSRLHIYPISINKEKLAEYVKAEKTHLYPYMSKYDFNSFFEIDIFFRLDMENVYLNLFIKKPHYQEFIQIASNFLFKLKDLPRNEFMPTIHFFLRYLNFKFEALPETPVFLYLLGKINLKFTKGLFQQRPSFNIENQFKAYLNSIYLLKKMGA
jgi:hypothetical protein